MWGCQVLLWTWLHADVSCCSWKEGGLQPLLALDAAKWCMLQGLDAISGVGKLMESFALTLDTVIGQAFEDWGTPKSGTPKSCDRHSAPRPLQLHNGDTASQEQLRTAAPGGAAHDCSSVAAVRGVGTGARGTPAVKHFMSRVTDASGGHAWEALVSPHVWRRAEGAGSMRTEHLLLPGVCGGTGAGSLPGSGGEQQPCFVRCLSNAHLLCWANTRTSACSQASPYGGCPLQFCTRHPFVVVLQRRTSLSGTNGLLTCKQSCRSCRGRSRRTSGSGGSLGKQPTNDLKRWLCGRAVATPVRQGPHTGRSLAWLCCRDEYEKMQQDLQRTATAVSKLEEENTLLKRRSSQSPEPAEEVDPLAAEQVCGSKGLK